MRRWAILLTLALVLLPACSRSFDAPPLGQPGTLSGRALSLGINGQWQPAAGAQASILATSLQAVAGSDGRFLITGLTQSGGRLLMTYAPMGAGELDQQVLISLDSLATGLGIQAQLGDIQLAATGGISGHLERIDQPDVGQQAGTTVYVPGAPFLTLTGPDGSFDLSPVPAGSLPLVAFRAGYLPLDFGQVVVSPGQLLLLSDHVLTLDTSTGTGSIVGSMALAGTSSVTGATVEAAGNFASQAGMLSADGSFTVPGLAPGLYTLTVAAPGYQDASVPNLLVLPNQPDDVGTISLAKGGASSSTVTSSSSSATVSSGTSGSGSSSGGGGSSSCASSSSGGMCTAAGFACTAASDCCETDCVIPAGGISLTCCTQIPSASTTAVACHSNFDCCHGLVCAALAASSGSSCCIPSGSVQRCVENADCCQGTCYSGGTCDPPDAGCYAVGENCGASSCCYEGICEASSQVCCVPLPSLNTAAPGTGCNGDESCCSGLVCSGATSSCCIPEAAGLSIACGSNADCCGPKICWNDARCHYVDGGT